MVKKEVISLLVKGGAATAGPPLGPALGPLGINIAKVVAEINARTKEMAGMDVPVKVIVDPLKKEFELEIGIPPTSALIKKEAGIERGSGAAGTAPASALAIEQIIKIAKVKGEALLGTELKKRIKEVLGTCVSVGVLVEGKSPKEVIAEVEAGKYDEEIKKGITELSAEKKAQLERIRKELAELAKKAQPEEEK